MVVRPGHLQGQREFKKFLEASGSVAIENCIVRVPLDCLIVKLDSSWEITCGRKEEEERKEEERRRGEEKGKERGKELKRRRGEEKRGNLRESERGKGERGRGKREDKEGREERKLRRCMSLSVHSNGILHTLCSHTRIQLGFTQTQLVSVGHYGDCCTRD